MSAVRQAEAELVVAVRALECSGRVILYGCVVGRVHLLAFVRVRKACFGRVSQLGDGDEEASLDIAIVLTKHVAVRGRVLRLSVPIGSVVQCGSSVEDVSIGGSVGVHDIVDVFACG